MVRLLTGSPVLAVVVHVDVVAALPRMRRGVVRLVGDGAFAVAAAAAVPRRHLHVLGHLSVGSSLSVPAPYWFCLWLPLGWVGAVAENE